ncbi:MAG TPA: hypothetical protein VFA60_13925 [Terriglobales bacterium]|nr:hypothetical protein [Terriglobales bacterium]
MYDRAHVPLDGLTHSRRRDRETRSWVNHLLQLADQVLAEPWSAEPAFSFPEESFHAHIQQARRTAKVMELRPRQR